MTLQADDDTELTYFLKTWSFVKYIVLKSFCEVMRNL